MPIYEFKCPECDNKIEQFFHFYSDHSIWCDKCKVQMDKQFAPNPAIFKGEGWGGKK